MKKIINCLKEHYWVVIGVIGFIGEQIVIHMIF